MSRRNAMRISVAGAAGVTVSRLVAALESHTGTEPRATAAAHPARDTLSRQLARFVVNTRFDDLPDPIIESWKTIVLDSLAIGFVGSKDRLAYAIGDVARRL